MVDNTSLKSHKITMAMWRGIYLETEVRSWNSYKKSIITKILYSERLQAKSLSNMHIISNPTKCQGWTMY